MASILKNAFIAINGTDLTCNSNAVAVDYSAEAQDDTGFCDDTRSNLGGLKNTTMTAEGYFEGTKDKALYDSVGVSGAVISVANGKTSGDASFTFNAVTGSYNPIQGSVGDIIGYDMEAMARGDLKRGNMLFYSDSETASGVSATFNGGAGDLTAYLHVLSASGTTPTLDVVIESNSSDSFAGTETDRITFDQATGQEVQTKTATTTDTWYRVDYTIGGTSPDFSFAVILVVE